MKIFLILAIMISTISCEKKIANIDGIFNDDSIELASLNDDIQPIINKEKNTIKERFSAPKNYTWIETKANSYGNFLENFPLKKYGSPIIKFNNEKSFNFGL